MNLRMKPFLLLALMLLVVGSTSCKSHKSHDSSGKSKKDKSKKDKSKDDDEDDEKDEVMDYDTAVKNYLKATDYYNLTRENLNASYTQMGLNPQYTKGLVDELMDKMPDKLVDIYSKYFTVEEINQLTKVNSDEIFKKHRKYQTQIIQDFMQEAQALATGQSSPTANVVVSSDFEAAVKDYYEADEIDKQLEQLRPALDNNLRNLGVRTDALDAYWEGAPDMIVRVYSKYFTTSEIKQLTALAKMPCSKKFRDKTPAITQDAQNEARSIAENYVKNHPY